MKYIVYNFACEPVIKQVSNDEAYYYYSYSGDTPEEAINKLIRALAQIKRSYLDEINHYMLMLEDTFKQEAKAKKLLASYLNT